MVAAPKEIILEHVPCMGVLYTDIIGVEYPPGFDLAINYPYSIHGRNAQCKWGGSNFSPTPTWSINTQGRLQDLRCKGIISRNTNDKAQVSTSTINGSSVCHNCYRLPHQMQLSRFLQRIAIGDFGRLPDPLCPVSTLNQRLATLRLDRQENRLSRLSSERKIASLLSRVDDNTRLLRVIQSEDIPDISRLMSVHFQNGGCVSSFVDKCMQASDYKMVGDDA